MLHVRNPIFEFTEKFEFEYQDKSKSEILELSDH